uniref:Kinesin motor domain-containing protein n=1 Tax=Takifugu rubripes TaxID=31033 RepID=A0A3B5JYF3_TAKRU
MFLQHRFYFDHVFGGESTNEEVYQRTAYPLVQHMLHRGSATCFAYGQTGSGKTHTMLGSSPGRPGLYALAVRDIFAHLSKAQTHPSLLVFVSFFEIYCGQLYDLLGGRKRLFAREDQQKVVHIAGLHEVRVESVGSLLEVCSLFQPHKTLRYCFPTRKTYNSQFNLTNQSNESFFSSLLLHSLTKVVSHGMAERTQGTSGVNAHSSRSHAMLQIQLRGQNQQMAGRMWFVDLAGSERASDTKDPDRQSRMEGAEINQSLLALKECIRSLDQAQSHTPFRQSKLTQVLKDSFLGDSMTCMIANISPGQAATEHTLNTLRYADRVKELRRQEGQGGRRSKTMSSKYDLSVNIGCNKTSVAARGKSPPKRPKIGRESDNFVPISSTSTLTTDDTVFCSTPKNSSCARARFGTRVEQLTPIRGSLGISVRRERADRNGGRKEKNNGEPDQSIRAGANLGKLHLRDARKKLEFSDRELEKELGISNRVTGCKCQGGHSENRDTSPEIHRPTELSSQNTEQKEKERHLREYHQQLQQLMPSFEPTPKHLLSSSPCQSFSCSHQVPQVSTSQHVSQNSVSARDSFDLETDSAPLGTKVDFESSYRGPLSSLTQEGLRIHNKGQHELGHGTLADTSKDVRVLMEDRKTKYGKKTGYVEKERTKTPTGEGQFILTQEYRRSAGMESGGKRRRAWETPAGSPQINAVTSARRGDMETPLFEASTADTAHTESAYYCSSAEHLFSPPCGDTDTLKATKGRAELPHELKGRTCASNLATSTNSGVKESWVVVSDSQTLPHNTPNIHNEYKDTAEAFSVFCSTEDSACNQVGSHPDTAGKMSLSSQGKAECASAIMDPLSISLLEVDQQVATASFLHGKESNSSHFGSGGVQRDACNNFEFSISQSTSESVRNALPNWRCEGRSNHPSDISVQPNTLAETHVDESSCEFQIRPSVHPSTLGDMYHVQCRVVQAHWDQMEEMETLFRKEGKLLYQQPDMEFGEYIHKLGEIMVRKARCIHGMLVQLQPYLKGIHSNQGNKHKEVINNLNE